MRLRGPLAKRASKLGGVALPSLVAGADPLDPLEPPPPRPGRGLIRRATLAMVAIVLLSAGAVGATGLLQVDAISQTFQDAQDANGGAITLPEVTPAEAGKPQTIMILGTDERLGADKGTTDEARSDTIILARMDARQDAISLMSIPRDLKVTIPGTTIVDKINSAFTRGGANLTAKTVKAVLSRPGKPFKINHVVQVSFTGFRRMVDFLGCTYVDIDRRYFNDVGGPGGYATIDIKPGYQKVCGKDALDYVRYRHTDNDIVRGARQQDFVRQMLRQPGVRQRLSFNNRTALAELAGKYTRTDKSLNKRQQIFTLLKLGLGVADKPVQQVPFGDGRLADDGPSYVTASQDAIDATVDQFMHPKTATASPSTAPTKRSSSAKRRSRSSSSKDWESTAGMQDVKSLGETQAISLARKLDFPFYYPTLLPSTGRYVDQLPRTYVIRDEDGKRHDAYRAVVNVGDFGEFMGIQGTTWKDPPILQGPHDTITVDRRKLSIYYDGKKVRLVSWRTKRGVYWVVNSLERTQPKSRLVATARSLTHLGR